MQVAELLDRVKQHTGTDKQTAETLDVRFQKVSDWRHGREPCPLTTQAKLCEMAGMTEGEQMRYVWEVVRERMGKGTGGVLGAVGSIACTGAAYALLAASRGSALMYRVTRANPHFVN